MSFSCSVCNYTSNIKQNVSTHISKKRKCGENPQIISSEADIKCIHCNKSYTTHLSMVRHLKTCKSKEKKDKLEIELEEKNQEVAEKDKECKILYESIEKIKKENLENLKRLQETNNTSNSKIYNGHIYIIHEREFVNLNQQVYKIGKTSSFHNRMNKYPKMSEIVIAIPVKNIDISELLCLQTIKELPNIFQTSHGTEYFEGNLELIVDTVMECCSKK